MKLLCAMLVLVVAVSAEETIHTLRLCQNEQPIHLTCPREEQDVVLLEDSVFWGRRDPSPCLTEEDDLQALDTNCYSQEAARTLYDECFGIRDCLLNPTTSKLGDPCPGTSKYLEVTYKCVVFM